MDNSEQLSPFDLAVLAFNVRFRQDLTSCWEKLRSATIPPLHTAAPEKKQGVLRKCFSDAAEQMAAVVHSHFPRLLAVATKQRPRWRGQQGTPMGWTAAHIREQAYNFLGMEDGNFKDTATPREDSRVLEATCQILYCAQCLPENSTDEFLLPWWADHGLLTRYWYGRAFRFPSILNPTVEVEDYPFSPPSGDDGECMSHAASLAWIRECEVEIRNKLESQIDAEMFDAVIAEGATGDTDRKSTRRRRAPRRRQEFTELARQLWLAARKDGQAIVSIGQLGEIAHEFDERGYHPPSDYLEKKDADELKAYNSKHSTSKVGGPIKTWGKLVQHGDKDHLRGMRRMLSRCASTPESS